MDDLTWNNFLYRCGRDHCIWNSAVPAMVSLSNIIYLFISMMINLLPLAYELTEIKSDFNNIPLSAV